MTLGERRSAQRFSMRLPALVRLANGGVHEEHTFTRDVSARGVYLYMNADPGEGRRIGFILSLPSEGLLTPPVDVQYEASVVRVEALSAHQFGVAARIELKEFLPVR